MSFPILAGLFLLQTDAFFPTPEHRWATEAIVVAEREKNLVPYPSYSHMDRRPPSRWEIAVGLHVAAKTQLDRAEAFVTDPSGDVERASLLRSAALLPAYQRARVEFRTELRMLEFNDGFGLARLRTLTRQIEATAPARDRLFRDVPADHWAAKAVGDLRALGLLDGYPDGRFRG